MAKSIFIIQHTIHCLPLRRRTLPLCIFHNCRWDVMSTSPWHQVTSATSPGSCEHWTVVPDSRHLQLFAIIPTPRYHSTHQIIAQLRTEIGVGHKVDLKITGESFIAIFIFAHYRRAWLYSIANNLHISSISHDARLGVSDCYEHSYVKPQLHITKNVIVMSHHLLVRDT